MDKNTQEIAKAKSTKRERLSTGAYFICIGLAMLIFGGPNSLIPAPALGGQSAGSFCIEARTDEERLLQTLHGGKDCSEEESTQQAAEDPTLAPNLTCRLDPNSQLGTAQLILSWDASEFPELDEIRTTVRGAGAPTMTAHDARAVGQEITISDLPLGSFTVETQVLADGEVIYRYDSSASLDSYGSGSCSTMSIQA
ncbi:hypothetical protein ACWIDW_04920 [Microbacterium sp. NPDC055312]